VGGILLYFRVEFSIIPNPNSDLILLKNWIIFNLQSNSFQVCRSIRGGSQLLNKRGGTYRLNENVKENGFIPGMSGMVNSMQVEMPLNKITDYGYHFNLCSFPSMLSNQIFVLQLAR
jgi:hypothetical protein